jgi:excisionase family DNA binding protein
MMPGQLAPPNLESLLVYSLVARVVEAVTKQLAEQPVKIQPALLTVAQAAEYLARSTRAVENMIQDGKLRTVRDGRRVFLARKDLDIWIENNTY